MRRALAASVAIAALAVGALAVGGLGTSAPASAGTGDAIRVGLSGGVLTVTAPAGLPAFGDMETLIAQDVPAQGVDSAVQVVIDEGIARLWSDSTGCTSAPAPVMSITCTGTISSVLLDFSAASVATQAAYNGTRPLSVLGGSGPDYVQGGNGLNVIDGAAGDDDLFGGLSDDTVMGGAGADHVEGDVGKDWLFGGPGVDSIDAQDDLADRQIDCGATIGDTVVYDVKLDQPEACNGPLITVADPRQGPAAGGTYVIFYGRGLEQVRSVSVGSGRGTVVSADDTMLVMQTPAGSGRVSITGATGNVALDMGGFRYLPTPLPTAVSPRAAHVGATIAINGSGLANPSAVFVGGARAAVVSSTATTLRVKVPRPVRWGIVDVTVITRGGQGTLSGGFRYL